MLVAVAEIFEERAESRLFFKGGGGTLRPLRAEFSCSKTRKASAKRPSIKHAPVTIETKR